MDEVRVLRNFLGLDARQYEPLYSAGQQIGHVARRYLPHLKRFLPLEKRGEAWHWRSEDEGERSEQLWALGQFLRERGFIGGWRDELLDVRPLQGGAVLARIERAMAALLGIHSFGVHLNVYCGDEVWFARRSALKSLAPLRLDPLVAGGVAAGFTPEATLLKEGQEEAGLTAEMLQRARPVGVCRYHQETPLGLRSDTLHCYDLEVAPDFTPQNQDGEVAEFLRHPIAAWRALLPQFKDNSLLTWVDFLIRHGHITPEHPHYLWLCAARHTDLTRLPA